MIITGIVTRVITASVCPIVVFSLDYSLVGLWALGAAYVLFSGLNILLYSRFQDFVPTAYRSVILSLYSIGDNIIYIGTCIIIGLGGMLGSWRYSILILGMMMIGVGLWALMFIRDRCTIENNRVHSAIDMARPLGKA